MEGNGSKRLEDLIKRVDHLADVVQTREGCKDIRLLVEKNVTDGLDSLRDWVISEGQQGNKMARSIMDSIELLKKKEPLVIQKEVSAPGPNSQVTLRTLAILLVVINFLFEIVGKLIDKL